MVDGDLPFAASRVFLRCAHFLFLDGTRYGGCLGNTNQTPTLPPLGFALRRQGPPYFLPPSALIQISSMWPTSLTMGTLI